MAAKLVLLILFAALEKVMSYNILALMTVPSHSHHKWNIIYLKALAKRGHQITYVSVDEYPNAPSNIRHIYIEGAYDVYEDLDFAKFIEQNPYEALQERLDFAVDYSERQWQQPGFKTFLEVIKGEKFDLVVFDLAATPYLLGCVDALGRPPIVGITAFGIPSWTLDLTATPYPVAISPHFTYPLGRQLSFTDRLENAAYFLFSWYRRKYYLLPQLDEISKKAFGSSTRSISEIENDLHINLVNANWATDNAFPLAPSLIPIGGLHISKPKTLPQDIQQFLDDSKHGVVYFSLGSNIQSCHLLNSDIQALLSAFKQLAPLNVLWKWENETLSGKSDNIKISKWWPQNDILAHPNVRLFMTHGGMLSSQEAVYHGVPMLGMPFFSDQHVNVKRAVTSAIAETVKGLNIDADNLVRVVKKIVENPEYKANAMRLSKIFRDNMELPLDRAVWWTEYAVRHKGAAHLRPLSYHLSWFQSGLYDLLLLSLAVGLTLVVTVHTIVKLSVIWMVRRRNGKFKTN